MIKTTFLRNFEYTNKSGIFFLHKSPLDVRIPSAIVFELQVFEKDEFFFVLFEKGWATLPHPYEIEKNGPRICDQGTKLPFRTKFHENP